VTPASTRPSASSRCCTGRAERVLDAAGRFNPYLELASRRCSISSTRMDDDRRSTATPSKRDRMPGRGARARRVFTSPSPKR
jgi:hypothetical protein